MAADVLIDEETKGVAAEQLASALRQLGTAADDAQKALYALPKHLQLAVLARLPLPHALLHLPPNLHAPALRAHHPSTDTHHTLHLQSLPPTAITPALLAARAITHLHALSLTALTLPRPTTALAPLLSALPALTGLNLHDAALSFAATATLAAVLPALPGLAALDLSANSITPPSMHALAPALGRCTSLATLNLLSAIRLDVPGCDSICILAAAVSTLTRLETLTIGSIGAARRTRPDHALSTGAVALLEALTHLPCMATLTLEVAQFKLAVDLVPRFAAALLRLSRLSRLDLAVPHLGAPIMHSTYAQQTWGGERDILGRALGALTQLSALKLDTCGLTFARRQAAPALSHLSALTGLRVLSMHLRDGRLQSADAPFQAAVVLGALPHMHALTELRCHCSTFAPRAASVATLVDLVATAMPQLRTLHLPVQAVAAGSSRLVTAILAATHIQRLSIDLYAIVNYGLDGDAYADELADVDFLSPYLPLLRFVRTLDVCIDEWHDLWLAPFAYNLAAFTALHRLSICSTDIKVGGPVCDILRGVSCIAPLRELAIDVSFFADGAAAAQRLLPSALGGAAALTALQCSVHCGGDVAGVAAHVLPATPHLRQLCLMGYPAAEHSACMAALAPLPLRTLIVHVAQPDQVAQVAELVRGLPHLRSLRLYGVVGAAEKQQVVAAAAESAACHDVRFEQD